MSLYGLKKDHHDFYKKVDSFLLFMGFVQCTSNTTIYIWRDGVDITILILYVDDLVLTRSSPNLIQCV